MYTEKLSNENDFYDIAEICGEIQWLKDPHYERSLYSLWEEFTLTDERKTLIMLLSRMIHHQQSDRYKALDFLINKIKEINLTPESTIFVATSNGMEVDGSTKGLYDFKAELARCEENWKEENFKPTIESSHGTIKNGRIKNIVIFDDFIGTGNSIIKRVKQLKDEINGNGKMNYFIFSYVGLNFGILHAENELGISISCPLRLKKGISDFPGAEQTKNEVLQMELKLQKKWNKLQLSTFSLGYNQSEALYQLYRSHCSNNVFPIFWWKYDTNGKFRNPLFNRLR